RPSAGGRRCLRTCINVIIAWVLLSSVSTLAAAAIEGQVLGGGAPLANATVTLWEASSDAPKQLAQSKTDREGRFQLRAEQEQSADVSLYLVATGGQPRGKGGDNPAIALLLVVGASPPAHVVIDEMPTIASVATHTQFIDGTAIKGWPLGLRIAAGNVPNFVDLTTGGYGATLLDSLNSAVTPPMANFPTLASILAACRPELRPHC